MRAHQQSSVTVTPSTRLSGFAASTLWHRRLDRAVLPISSKVHPRVCAELVLRSVLPGRTGEADHHLRRIDDAYHAA